VHCCQAASTIAAAHLDTGKNDEELNCKMWELKHHAAAFRTPLHAAIGFSSVVLC
jgi:hypothetical protein